MSRKSTQIALGGVFSSLCLMLMFLTGMVPFSVYVLPALAGAMLVAVIVENGRKTAALVYITVSVLSVFIVPDREASMMFIVFFGYYPIIKGLLDGLQSKAARLTLKLLVFNAAIVGGYLFLIFALGMEEMMEGMGDFGKYTMVILLGLGNVVFWIYDYALEKYTFIYVNWFKPTFLRR